MATKEMRVCDAYGTVKDVQRVVVEMKVETTPGVWSLYDAYKGDLSQRGRVRLNRFIERGLSSVHKDEPPAASTEATEGSGAAV